MSGFLTSSGWWLTKVVGTYKKYGFHERKKNTTELFHMGCGHSTLMVFPFKHCIYADEDLYKGATDYAE